MEYPEWLIRSLIQFNHHTTCMNEWELMDVKAIDLHRQPDLPQRLDVLFTSLQDGFGKETLVCGNFLALGYNTEAGTRVFPRFVEFGKNAQAMLELRNNDSDAAVRVFEQAQKCMHSNTQQQLIVQIPYFIRQVDRYASDCDISLTEFQQKFDNNQVIFTDVEKVASAADVTSWLKQHESAWYEQRFLFTLGLNAANGITNTISEPKIKEALGYFMGSFLSWAGMGVADSTRYVMAAAAARLAHYSHEFLKPFGELQDFLNTHPSSVPAELEKWLRPVLANVKVLELSNIAVGFSSKYYNFRMLLKQALMRNTSLKEEQDLADGRYDFTLTIGDVNNMQVHVNFEGLPDDSVSIRFDPSFFDRLIRNLLRNAAQHSKSPDQLVKINFSVKLNDEYGLLTMCFKHLGSTIKRQVTRLLFRMPIPDTSTGDSGKSKNKASKGIGLWTVGMAFEAQRLSLPEVSQEKDGVAFIFRFPMKRQ